MSKRIEPVTGAIVAGGRSRRMGADKRALPVEGVPMLRRVALAVSAVADDVVVACREVDPPDPGLLGGLDVRLAFDRRPDAGPLAGVEAALSAAAHDLVLVVAGDMPWLEPRVLALLVAEAAAHREALAVALLTERGPEPLLAVYRRDALAVVTRLLDGGVGRMHALLDEIAPLAVPPDRWLPLDASGRTAANVNEPGELRRA